MAVAGAAEVAAEGAWQCGAELVVHMVVPWCTGRALVVFWSCPGRALVVPLSRSVAVGRGFCSSSTNNNTMSNSQL